MAEKLVGGWILGALFLLAGTWIVSNLRLDIGVSELSFVLALVIAFILYLVGGLLWISVAVATRHKEH
jgi:hypothetical protein